MAVVIRNEAGQIIEHDETQVFYSGTLPKGLRPSGQLRAVYPLTAKMIEEVPFSVEVSIIEIRARYP